MSSIIQQAPKRHAVARAALACLLAIQLTASGCSTPKRLPAVPSHATALAQPGLGPIRFLPERDTGEFGRELIADIQREEAYLASSGHTGPMPPYDILAISGGGDNGAFGAGLLVGWTINGSRPQFDVVTGVSTGALIAPFAFLGSKYDPVLEKLYTQISPKDIFKKRSLLSALFKDAAADTSPLYSLIEKTIDQKVLDDIAAEYTKGRVLLVGTTNFDALEPVIWNMTAIASSKDPRAPELFRKILLASASIPGAFPPVMIDVELDGVRYSEMHVDGGTIQQVFLYPPSTHLGQREAAIHDQRKQSLYLIRNAKLDPDWAAVERRTLPIAARAIGSLTGTQAIGDLYQIYITAKRDDIDYNQAHIPESFNAPHKEEFDTAYMRQLFATGRDLAVAGYKWEKVPPGYDEALLVAEPEK